MFGYVTTYKPELTIKDYYKYRAYYCGLCESLRRKFGVKGQVTLSYDMTFIVILLTSLYECTSEPMAKRCIVHPAKKTPMLINRMTEYAADMNMILAYYHFEDDWLDEKSVKGLAGKLMIRRQVRKLEGKYPRQCKAIRSGLKRLAALEKKKVQDVDAVAGCFGDILAEITVCQKDIWEPQLRTIGFYLGKFVYIMDAVDDLEEDMRKGRYNPLSHQYHTQSKSDFMEECRQMLTMMIAQVSQAYESLPCLIDTRILNNILYAGVWNKFNQLTQGKSKEAQMLELLKN